MPLARNGKVKKLAGKQKRKESYTKSQRRKDNETLVSLDRSIQDQHRQLREQAENPIPKPKHQPSHPEEWKILLQMNELAQSSIPAKPSTATSELRTQKRQEATVLRNLLDGLNSIDVSSDKAQQSSVPQRLSPINNGKNKSESDIDI